MLVLPVEGSLQFIYYQLPCLVFVFIAALIAVCSDVGVIAVVTYGLYGAYTSTWDMDVHVLESGAFDSFYESLAFLVNGIIFFYSGVSCVNFVVR